MARIGIGSGPCSGVHHARQARLGQAALPHRDRPLAPRQRRASGGRRRPRSPASQPGSVVEPRPVVELDAPQAGERLVDRRLGGAEQRALEVQVGEQRAVGERTFADTCSMFAPSRGTVKWPRTHGKTPRCRCRSTTPPIRASPTTSTSPTRRRAAASSATSSSSPRASRPSTRLLTSGHRRALRARDAAGTAPASRPRSTTSTRRSTWRRKPVLAATVGFDLHRGAVAAADRRPLPAARRRRRRGPHARRPRGAQRPREPRRRRPLGPRVRRRRRSCSIRRASTRTTGARCGSAWARCSTCPSPAP